jgi:hypothetical protein
MKQLEEELQQQALALDEFMEGLTAMQGNLPSPSSNETCDAKTLATGDIIPSDRPDVTPVVTGRTKFGFVPTRRVPPSTVLNGGGAKIGASLREEGQRKHQVSHELPPEATEHEPNPLPIVIWRHSAPIKIATNVPPELLLPPGQVDLYESIVPSDGSSCEAGWSDTGSAAGSLKKLVKPRGTGYGAAWYLPVGQWEASAKGVDLGAKEELVEEGRAAGAKSSPESRADDEVAALYSSKRYAEYLREKKVARVPHYLADLKIEGK